MKTKKILYIFLTSVLLIACKPNSNKQNEGQESIALEEQDSLTPEDKEYLAHLDSVIEAYEEEVIVVVNKSDKYSKTDEPDNMEGLISILDFRKVENSSDAEYEYVKDSEIPDSLFKIAEIAEKFIKWYINDSCPIDQEELFILSDSLGYYIFDTEYGDYYLTELKKTEVVSDSLIRQLRWSFEASKIRMENKKYGPETDFVISYEADILFYSQDMPDPFQIKDMKLKSFVFYSSKSIGVGFNGTGAELIYENGEWKVIRGG